MINKHSPFAPGLIGRSRKGDAVMSLFGRTVIMSAVIGIAACAGPGQQKKQTPISVANKQVPWQQPATKAQASVAVKVARTLSVMAVDPDHYQVARNQRIEALSSRPDDVLSPKGVGYYMEVLEAKLRQSIAGMDIGAVFQGKDIVIGPVEDAFAHGSVNLANEVRPMLAAVAPVLTEFSKTLITVHCYTDSSGADDYNRRLSKLRGLVIARYLVKAGVNGSRILVVGYGESKPVASNATAKGRARNRRIEIELTPLAR